VSALPAAALAVALLLSATPRQGPVVIDPGPPSVPSEALAGSVRDLAPAVRDLVPRVRDLVPSVRELRTEEREGQRTTVTISADVLFDFDSADLTPAAQRVVDELVGRVRATDSAVLVVGHTDGIGTLAYNQDLSERRAAAVADRLRAGLGDGRTFTVEGRNFSQPIAPEMVNGEDSPEGRARNRRVEIAFDEPGR
jgi:OOP family OmpA-OmpF porin